MTTSHWRRAAGTGMVCTQGRSGGVLVWLLAGVVVMTAAPLVAAEPAAAVTEDPLLDLNVAFREQYARERQQRLERSGPILLLMGDTLTLIRPGDRRQSSISPEEYLRLKMISHAALGVYVHLAGVTDGSLSPEDLERLEGYRLRVMAAREALDRYDFGTAGTARQQAILNESANLLTETIRAKSCTSGALTAFARRVGPLLMENAEVAARLQLDAIHAQVQRWKQELSVEEWRSLRAIVVGSQLPRRGALGVQYFARLLGEAGEGRRVLYAEALFDEERALRLAGTHTIDRTIGVAFFDDDERMHRDLLADATERYLDELFPREEGEREGR